MGEKRIRQRFGVFKQHSCGIGIGALNMADPTSYWFREPVMASALNALLP